MSNSTTGNSFILTEDDLNLSGKLSFWFTIPGICISFLVLLAICIFACTKRSRKKLDRVSFRLVVYTLIFNVLYGIAYEITPNHSGSLCNFSAFAVNFTLSLSTYFTTCIALNLQIVLVHRLNGRRMEKYYIITTVLLASLLNVTALGLHQFGWDEDTGTCWYSNKDPEVRLKWIIGTQSFWTLLAATIEMICSCVVLVWMYRELRGLSSTAMDGVRHDPLSGKVEMSKMGTSKDGVMPITLVMRDKYYRAIILRIAMYPVISLVLNYTTVILDLYTTTHGIVTRYDFDLLILDLIFYGIRPLIYGFLAATDPAFICAVREMRGNAQRRGEGYYTNRVESISATLAASGTLSQRILFVGSSVVCNSTIVQDDDSMMAGREVLQLERQL